MDRQAERTYMDWQTVGRVPRDGKGLVLYVHVQARTPRDGYFRFVVQLYETPTQAAFADFCEEIADFMEKDGPLPHPEGPIFLCSGEGIEAWKASLACIDVRIGGSPQRAASKLLAFWLHQNKAGEGSAGGCRLRVEIHVEGIRSNIGPYYVFERTADWLPAEFRSSSESAPLPSHISKVARSDYLRKNAKGNIRGVHFDGKAPAKEREERAELEAEQYAFSGKPEHLFQR